RQRARPQAPREEEMDQGRVRRGRTARSGARAGLCRHRWWGCEAARRAAAERPPGRQRGRVHGRLSAVGARVEPAAPSGRALVMLLMRHAWAGHRDEWDGHDHERPLDDRGYEQAAALVERLEPYRIDAIMTSPYVRCVATVEPLAAARGLELEL